MLYSMKKIFLLIILACSIATVTININAQTITLEGGGGYIPTTLTPTWGVSLQIPVYDKFAVYGAFTRFTTDDPRRAAAIEDVKRQYPIQNGSDPNFIFPQPPYLGTFWGNQIWSAGVTYTLGQAENFSFDVGAGWCGIQGVGYFPGLGNGNIIVFREAILTLQYQSINAFGLVHYALSPAFSLQGKLAFYGLTHGLAMVGVSWKPF